MHGRRSWGRPSLVLSMRRLYVKGYKQYTHKQKNGRLVKRVGVVSTISGQKCENTISPKIIPFFHTNPSKGTQERSGKSGWGSGL